MLAAKKTAKRNDHTHCNDGLRPRGLGKNPQDSPAATGWMVVDLVDSWWMNGWWLVLCYLISGCWMVDLWVMVNDFWLAMENDLWLAMVDEWFRMVCKQIWVTKNPKNWCTDPLPCCEYHKPSMMFHTSCQWQLGMMVAAARFNGWDC